LTLCDLNSEEERDARVAGTHGEKFEIFAAISHEMKINSLFQDDHQSLDRVPFGFYN